MHLTRSEVRDQMFTRFLRRPIYFGIMSLFLLTAGVASSIIIPEISLAEGPVHPKPDLQTPTAIDTPQIEPVLETMTDRVVLLGIATNEIVYNPQDQLIYATRPSRVGTDGNSITGINPLTGQIGASVYVGSEPNRIALSDNGQTIYVTLDGAFAIRRYETSTQLPGLQFAIGRGQSVSANDAPLLASDIAVAPGNPDLLAVARTIPGI